MPLILELFLIFFKTGLFSFGGGYAMITVIEHEVVGRGFVTAAQYADIVAISQVTPGPLAINAATYVGALVAPNPALGIFYSAAATLGVSLPSFILIFIIVKFFKSFGESNAVKNSMGGIRPSVIGLILAAVVSFARLSIIDLDKLASFDILGGIDPKALIIAAAAFFVNLKTKVSPILILIGSGVTGIILFSF